MLSGNTTFLELLSLAGGLTKEAGNKATIKGSLLPERRKKGSSLLT
jgi:hypothetical protein